MTRNENVSGTDRQATTGGELVVDRICKTHPGIGPVLNDVSFSAGPGDALAIVGPSGSGKSTLLHILGSLESPSSGRILLDARDIAALTGDALADYRARSVGFVFQDHHLLPQLTARENALLPGLALHPAAGEQDRAEREARIDALLDRVGVSARANAFPAAMSGGERQRVAIARALCNGPALLLCDEPTGNLDRDTGLGIVDLFLQAAGEQRAIVVMVTHNTELAERFPRRFRLSQGRLTRMA